jgi:hypothetical protein
VARVPVTAPVKFSLAHLNPSIIPLVIPALRSPLHRYRNLDRPVPADVSGRIDQSVNRFHLAIIEDIGAAESALL